MEHKVINIEKTRTLDSTQDPKTASSFKIKATQEYTTELSVVVAILQCSENTFWIHDFSAEKNIQKISLQNDSSIKVLLNFKEYAFRTALMGNGDLLISDETSNLKILKMNATKLKTSVYNLNPYIALSLHCSSDKKVIVGGTKKLPIDYSVTGGGVVIVMDLEGHHEVVYEFDKNKKPLFTNPAGIITSKGNIMIIDQITSDFKGKVITLEKGIVSQIYTGHNDVNCKNHPFKPEQIATTQLDNVIISDMYNNTIHVLDNSGHLLFYCNTMEAGVMGPASLTFIKQGKLLIGCSIPKLSAKNPNAKIYEIKETKDHRVINIKEVGQQDVKPQNTKTSMPKSNTCQLCETNGNIKWKCEDCELMMCDGCKTRVHLKIKEFKDHRLIAIEDMDLQKNIIPCKIKTIKQYTTE
ncbi:unnamed protein product [Mytilus coruscus]|uniref:B box-type domain-containing protein n=1 Tax=Mytilus coruscus TaxID=42192 RepID=A0A6J8EG46_MYTCO|nr:unnamed protein product [Mytilus coruscus]